MNRFPKDKYPTRRIFNFCLVRRTSVAHRVRRHPPVSVYDPGPKLITQSIKVLNINEFVCLFPSRRGRGRNLQTPRDFPVLVWTGMGTVVGSEASGTPFFPNPGNPGRGLRSLDFQSEDSGRIR